MYFIYITEKLNYIILKYNYWCIVVVLVIFFISRTVTE